MPAGDPATLSRLRHAVAEIEGSDLSALEAGGRVLPLGAELIDAALGGGLAFGALHELAPAAPLHLGAACGFALALAARARRASSRILDPARFRRASKAARSMAPASPRSGLPMERLLLLRVARPVDVLWAMEEALKSPRARRRHRRTDGRRRLPPTSPRRAGSRSPRATAAGFGFLLRHRISPRAERRGDALGRRRRARRARRFRRPRPHRFLLFRS